METALDALYAKAEAFEDMKGPFWSRWARGYVDSINGKDYGTAPASPALYATSEELTASLTRLLDSADTFYVSPDMNRLIVAAAESWEADEPCWMEDFPTHTGWLYIPGGISRLDIRGQIMVTSVITWAIIGPGVVLTYWADKRNDRPDIKERPFWQQMPRLTPWHTTMTTWGRPLPQSIQMGTLLPPEVSNQIKWGRGPNGELAALIPEGWSPEQLTPIARTDSIMAWLVSALRIMQTPIADVRRQGLPAAMRKDLAKRPHRFKNKAVTVIEFRRRTSEFASHGEREFSHRWLRRGHWRKQWYGSEKTGDRRQVRIWIHPTICGPEDKPVLLRQHVNALVR